MEKQSAISLMASMFLPSVFSLLNKKYWWNIWHELYINILIWVPSLVTQSPLE